MRRSHNIFVWAVVGATLLCAGPVGAQNGPQPRPDITRAAVQAVASELHVGERLPRGRIGFESRVLEPRPAPGSGTDAVGYVLGDAEHPETIYTMLGAEYADFEHSVVCETSSPRSCRLTGVVAVFAATEPRPTASGAEVVVAARWRSDLAKMPVGYTRYLVTLTRAETGEWVVCGIRTELIS